LYRKFAELFLLAFDNFEGRSVYGCRKYLEETQWMRRRHLQRLQLNRLKALLKYAYENVPYYNKMLKNANFKPSMLRCLGDLQRVPILRRSAIENSSDELWARTLKGRGLFSWSTSGTTATPISFCRTKTDLSWGLGAELRSYSWVGYEIGDKLAIIWRVLEHGLKFQLRNLLKRAMVFDVHTISEKTMESFARKMHRFKPKFVRGYAGSTNLFATFLEANEHFQIQPEAVFTSAQTLQPYYRRNIEKAFNCRVFDCYGTNEIYFVAGQCGEHEGLHVAEENVIVEVVEGDEQVADGEEGRVLLTNLHSFAMPFIRYDVGDLGRVFPERCSCGRTLRLFKPIGRTYEYFLNSDGSFTFLKDFQTFFEGVPIGDFQVVQEAYDKITIKIAPKPAYNEKHTRFILENIKLRGSAEIQVKLVDSIALDESGKIPHVVSKLVTRYT